MYTFSWAKPIHPSLVSSSIEPNIVAIQTFESRQFVWQFYKKLAAVRCAPHVHLLQNSCPLKSQRHLSNSTRNCRFSLCRCNAAPTRYIQGQAIYLHSYVPILLRLGASAICGRVISSAFTHSFYAISAVVPLRQAVCYACHTKTVLNCCIGKTKYPRPKYNEPVHNNKQQTADLPAHISILIDCGAIVRSPVVQNAILAPYFTCLLMSNLIIRLCLDTGYALKLSLSTSSNSFTAIYFSRFALTFRSHQSHSAIEQNGQFFNKHSIDDDDNALPFNLIAVFSCLSVSCVDTPSSNQHN